MKDAASREWYPALPANVVAQTAAALGEPFDYVSDEDLNI
jgi:hypothetical protein